jgi:hypothetical protein
MFFLNLLSIFLKFVGFLCFRFLNLFPFFLYSACIYHILLIVHSQEAHVQSQGKNSICLTQLVVTPSFEVIVAT